MGFQSSIVSGMTRDAYVQQSDDAMMKEVVLVRVVVLPFMVVVWFCWHWASDDSGINIVVMVVV